jgi:hypothetical protein
MFICCDVPVLSLMAVVGESMSRCHCSSVTVGVGNGKINIFTVYLSGVSLFQQKVCKENTIKPLQITK